VSDAREDKAAVDCQCRAEKINIFLELRSEPVRKINCPQRWILLLGWKIFKLFVFVGEIEILKPYGVNEPKSTPVHQLPDDPVSAEIWICVDEERKLAVGHNLVADFDSDPTASIDVVPQLYTPLLYKNLLYC
jgi:hypothetical protein